MNSILSHNLELFSIRFPELNELLKDELNAYLNASEHKMLTIIQAKNGSPTAIYNGISVHSKYNPEREAEQLISSKEYKKDSSIGVFLGAGLGYAPILFAKKNPSLPIIIVEKDAKILFEAFETLDWSIVLKREALSFIINAAPGTLLSVLGDNAFKAVVFCTPSCTCYAPDYFKSFLETINQQKQKDEINTNTLEKFAHLWLKNSCRNLSYLSILDGVDSFFDLASPKNCNLPFIILAAGPSLEDILPHLAELKKRAIIVCVNTALHAVLKANVEPDFILLVDPQYACAKHLDFLSSPSSILITESAVWPSVFRFNCKQIVLCSSLFPIGQYFEKYLGNKGALGAGGSVTTTAWDFARKCGSASIYMAGMDFGFPNGQTHIKGSQFEEMAHRISNRLHTVESDSVNAITQASVTKAFDYDGNPILTDKRMSLFSWWFEKSTQTALEDGQKTYSLTSKSMAIKGIQKASVEDILSRTERISDRETFFTEAKKRTKTAPQKDEIKMLHQKVLKEFIASLSYLGELSDEGLKICKKAPEDKKNTNAYIARLQDIDNKILTSSAKEAAALVFPTQRQLDNLTKDLPQDTVLKQFEYSSIIYSQLKKAVIEYKKHLS